MTTPGLLAVIVVVGCGGSTPPTPAHAVPCTVDATYAFGHRGGMGPGGCGWSKLVPPLAYEVGGAPVQGSPNTCVSTLQCQDATTQRVLTVLSSAAVERALASPQVIYGVDARTYDGQVFFLERADGKGFLVGQPCRADQATCRAIPAELQELVAAFDALAAQPHPGATCKDLSARPAACY